MLVIRRKEGETLILGNRIRITILETHSGGVKIGIEAPADVSVHRAEVIKAVGDANRLAGESQPTPALAARLPRSDRSGEVSLQPLPDKGD